MFSNRLSDLTFATREASQLYPFISGDLYYNDDKTLKATLYATIPGRVKQDTPLKVVQHYTDFRISTLEEHPPVACAQSFFSRLAGTDVLHIIDVTNSGSERVMEILDKCGSGNEFMTDFRREADLTVFLQKAMHAAVFSMPSKHLTAIFVRDLNMRKWHMLQSVLPRLLPWFFEDKLTELEIALFKSLALSNSNEYERVIEQISQSIDFRSIIIKNRLDGIESIFEEHKILEMINVIERNKSLLADYYNHISGCLCSIREKEAELLGYRLRVQEKQNEESEITNYFLCNKNASVISVSGSRITFVMRGFMDIYDEEAFLSVADNRHSYLYTYLPPDVNHFCAEQLYRAIFQHQSLKLRCCAAYVADLSGTIAGCMSFHMYPPETKDYLPNPHIENYGCIGNNEKLFYEHMERGDYTGAIIQAAASARNINFFDSTVGGTFTKLLFESRRKCIETPEGVVMTPRQALSLFETTNEEFKEET